MIQSMTGFGKAQLMTNGKNITIEIRSLNSRQADLNLKLPALYREKEYEIRNLIIAALERGKIDTVINIDYTDGSHVATLNLPVAVSYYDQLKILEKQLGIENSLTDYIEIIARLPEVFKNPESEIAEEVWNLLLKGLNEALSKVIAFRKEEGLILAKDMENRIKEIESMLQSIQPFEEERIESLRNKIIKELMNLPNQPVYDKNRFEQEMIYWLEKIDFTEEKIRLTKHLHHFLRTMEEESAQGKKLGFIAQEIGREINTLGSKANHAGIQQIVVSMKDELEKIKEQLLNIL
ncbi:MAG: YicC family protein [Lentimicrobium sp.]